MTTSDKTLLELAAKAAEILPSDFGGEHDLEEWWSPLTDDGDALRLAVKLRMNVYVDTHTVVAEICSDSDCSNIYKKVFITEDEYAATRRAIVRAAAKIGEAI